MKTTKIQVGMMNTSKLFLFSFLAFALCTSAYADKIFKWTDKAGVVHFSQALPQGENIEIITTKTPRAALPDTAEAVTAKPSKSAEEKEQGNESEVPAIMEKNPKACEEANRIIDTIAKTPILQREGKIMTIEETNEELDKMRQVKEIHCEE